jgi:hypothetical protein
MQREGEREEEAGTGPPTKLRAGPCCSSCLGGSRGTPLGTRPGWPGHGNNWAGHVWAGQTKSVFMLDHRAPGYMYIYRWRVTMTSTREEESMAWAVGEAGVTDKYFKINNSEYKRTLLA